MNALLTQWAQRWSAPPQAMAELGALLKGLDVTPAEVLEGASESHVQSRIRLEAANLGIRLWRNNVGAGKLLAEGSTEGSFVRFGLANDSKAVNARLKSGDLIGCRPVLIRPEHVGHVIGQFVSREVKHGGWVWKGTDREVAQAAWCALINGMGGDAKFAAGEGSFA